MPVPGGRPALPVAGQGSTAPPERADAARNRARVLAAAEELFVQRGVAAVTMDDIAGAAGVGKGTLYRRFGDKGGLGVALLDTREKDLQHRMISGPAPLGPGAPPHERLAAFVVAYADFVASHLDLVLMSETSTPGARHRTGAHAFWRSHCRHLLAEAGAVDPEIRAEVLLAALSAEQVSYWLREAQASLSEVSERLAEIARVLAGSR